MPEMHKVYVSNLPFGADEDALEGAFRDGLGQDAVTGVEIIRNREGQPKGFGFVVLADAEAVHQAIEKMHRTPLMGREISVTRAIPKDQMPPRANPDRRAPPMGGMRPSSRDYNGYTRAPMGGYMPPAAGMPVRGGYAPPPMRVPPPARGGFKVSVSGLPAHFTWRELKDFLRTGSRDVTYADVRRPGIGVGEWATAQERSMAIRALQGVALDGYSIRIREEDDDVEPLAGPMAAGPMRGPPMAPVGRMSAYYDDGPMYRGGDGYGRGGMAPRGGYAARDPYYDDLRAPPPLVSRAPPLRPPAYDMPLSSREVPMGRDVVPLRGARDIGPVSSRDIPIAPRGYSRMPSDPPMAAPYYPADGGSRYADRAAMYGGGRSISREPPARYARPSTAAPYVRGGPSRYAPY